MPQTIVSLEDVSFSYGTIDILQNITLAIQEGEFIGLIGPNGGGKTTLLKLIMGLLKPHKGAIKLFHENLRQALLQIGYVPQVMQFDRLFPITVEELVLGGRLSRLPWHGFFKKEDKLAVYRALEQVNLAKYYNEPFSALSGGEAQRALIARALATPNLKLLILDEPTAHVDAVAEEEIFSLLKTLHRSITIIMVTHDLQAALSCFDKVVCVHRQAAFLDPGQVCEHYALGLYHAPLSKRASWKGEL
jgi:zinc transport system ATP-binding protein